MLVKRDQRTYDRIQRIAQTVALADPTSRVRSCAAAVRTCVVRAIDALEAEVAGAGIDMADSACVSHSPTASRGWGRSDTSRGDATPLV